MAQQADCKLTLQPADNCTLLPKPKAARSSWLTWRGAQIERLQDLNAQLRRKLEDDHDKLTVRRLHPRTTSFTRSQRPLAVPCDWQYGTSDSASLQAKLQQEVDSLSLRLQREHGSKEAWKQQARAHESDLQTIVLVPPTSHPLLTPGNLPEVCVQA